MRTSARQIRHQAASRRVAGKATRLQINLIHTSRTVAARLQEPDQIGGYARGAREDSGLLSVTGYPSASIFGCTVQGCRLTGWHGQGAAVPAALDPVRGIMPVIKDQITSLRRHNA
jgi:hypothetical protein